jgi:glycosyltransferase involved in cell wall biosynthesis
MKTRDPKSVLFVINTLGAGGAERQMVLLIEGLIQKGLRCRVFVIDGRGPLRPRLDALGVEVHEARLFAEASVLRDTLTMVIALFRLWWTVLRMRPDVVQTYLPVMNFVGSLAGRLAGVPKVITCRRGLGTHQDRHKWWPIFDRVTNRLSHVVTVNSRAVAVDTIERDGIEIDKLALIPNGIDMSFLQVKSSRDDVRRELGLHGNEIGIVTVANLIPYKGHAELLHAFAMSLPRLQPCKLFAVGRDDGIGTNLKQLAVDLGVDDRVRFLGSRNDVGSILGAIDLFILASHEEGSSNALLEAMAFGLPIIATDVGGNREALGNGRFGSIVPPRNADALAEAMQALVQGIASGRERGQEASRFVGERYSSGRLVDSYLALYRSDAIPKTVSLSAM